MTGTTCVSYPAAANIASAKSFQPIYPLAVIEPAVHGDSRGYFTETYNKRDMAVERKSILERRPLTILVAQYERRAVFKRIALGIRG